MRSSGQLYTDDAEASSSRRAAVRPPAPVQPTENRPGWPRLVMTGGVGGLLSGLLGVGGGVVMVPLLVLWAGYSQHFAHALSLGAMIPISAGGIAAYGASGHLRAPEAAMLAAGSVIGARQGAALLSRLDERVLKLAFGGFLVLVAATMLAPW